MTLSSQHVNTQTIKFLKKTIMHFISFPKLTTKRLILRYLNETDCSAIFALRSDDVVNKYLDRPKMKNIDEANEFIKNINDGISLNKWLYWGICSKNNPELIGTICLWNFSNDKTTAEIGYELIPSFQGKGLMGEALKSIVNFGFQEIELKKIEAFTHIDNLSSKHLLEKNDFKLEVDRTDDTNVNNIIYSLTR